MQHPTIIRHSGRLSTIIYVNPINFYILFLIVNLLIFLFGPSYPPSRALLLSFAMWGDCLPVAQPRPLFESYWETKTRYLAYLVERFFVSRVCFWVVYCKWHNSHSAFCCLNSEKIVSNFWTIAIVIPSRDSNLDLMHTIQQLTAVASYVRPLGHHGQVNLFTLKIINTLNYI